MLALTSLLDEPVEGTAKLDQAGAFFLEDAEIARSLTPDVWCACVGDASIFEPRVQLGENS